MKRWIYSFLILVGAGVVSAALAFGNFYYYQWLKGYLPVQGAFLSALLYSSFLLLIGATIVSRRPRFFGFQIGDSGKRWKLVFLVTAGLCAFTALVLSRLPRTPYSGANWVVEMLLVPVSEETMWRGVIFSYMYLILSQWHGERTTLVLSVLFSSLAFGLAHASNFLVLPASFVVLQILFAAITGVGMGYLRAKTRSIYPAMLVHAMFNLVAILF